MDNSNIDSPLYAIHFELDDYKCVRFFDRGGNLSVLGPNESRESLYRYVSKYAPLCRDNSLRQFLAPIRPETHVYEKLHAILDLMEEYEDEIAHGMGIGPELVITALDAFGPWEPMDPETLSLIAGPED
jgi:hypothetical protein